MSTEPVTEQPPIPGGLAARLHKHEQFASRLVEVNHDLLVYLPPMYQTEGERRFSVLYMHDGQNLFDPETSFIRGKYWHMGETADALIEVVAVEPLIIVGIYNTGERRLAEWEVSWLPGYHADQRSSRHFEQRENLWSNHGE